ncbi:GntR family transcriptional regulator [Streptomyces chartreusis]|uniref:GntR family transcriptional regulator n=1 Tax=Streptomyces chartreusis TaxID=1969 RepID=UPI0033C71B03
MSVPKSAASTRVTLRRRWRARSHSLDPESGRPLYLQLADVIESRSRSGEYAPGRMIPASLRLAEEYGIAHMTVRRSMRELRERGVI